MRPGQLSAGEPCSVDGCPFRELADGLCIEHIHHPAPAANDPSPPPSAPTRSKTTNTPKE